MICPRKMKMFFRTSKNVFTILQPKLQMFSHRIKMFFQIVKREIAKIRRAAYFCFL